VTLEQFASKFVDWVWSIPLFFMLLGCGLLFSILSKFVQWRILSHGYTCIRGHYDRPDDVGHISHFQALCAALSATVGLGNIAGVAVAVSLGGPGAVFWMWVVGLFGMALKFMECSLAVMFRDVRDVPDPSAPALMEADAEERTLEYAGEAQPERGAIPRARGEVRGGPMWYMQKALVEPLRARGNPLWFAFKVLAVMFAISTILNSFGGGNMFQGWNVSQMLKKHFALPTYFSAAVVSVLVAIVIIGGIKRIGQVASKLVPFMCAAYVLGAVYILILHASEVPQYLSMIVEQAFTPTAEGGAFAGVTAWVAFTWGLKRACFSNEAGEGSAAIAHAAAKTDEPIREGVVAGLEPFIDTLVICTMTALVILITGAWNRPAVGVVERVSDQEVLVRCDGDIPEKLEPLYVQRVLADDQRHLSVHLSRGVDADFSDLKIPMKEVIRRSDGVEAAGVLPNWDAITHISLDLSGVEAEDREKIGRLRPDQPVHLAIEGADLTGFAFDTTVPGFGKYIVTLGVCLFAFSTMISWSYYGEKGAEFLLGPGAILPFKFVFVVFVFLGMVLPKFETVYNFSDATTGLMVMCNLPAVLILSPVVLRASWHYFQRLDSGQMPRVR
jgi:alanine or glycine:cation symporter, AGCS family